MALVIRTLAWRLNRVVVVASQQRPTRMEARWVKRYFSEDKGKILSEEERAKETVYIQKMERELLEKKRLKAEKEKAESHKAKINQKPEEPLRG